MSGKAEQALGLGTKIVDVLAESYAQDCCTLADAGQDSSASDTHKEPRINVTATGHHVDTVHESHENEMRRREAERERRSDAGSDDFKASDDFKPIDHHHGPGIARPGDEDRMRNLDEASSRSIPHA